MVNIDQYDVLVGTPFMHQFKVILDFKNNCIHINNQGIPAETVNIDGEPPDVQHHRLRHPNAPNECK